MQIGWQIPVIDALFPPTMYVRYSMAQGCIHIFFSQQQKKAANSKLHV